MKYAGRLAAVAVVGALSLAACGTDDNSAGGSNGTTAATASAAAGNSNGLSGTINAAGSSAQANAIDQWKKDFQAKNSGVSLNYQPSGSGAGVQSFIAGTVDLAGSDSALKDDKGEPAQADARCKTGKAINIPMVTGPVAVVYNLPGVEGLQ
ncbi:MAG: phosphate ABC transporter substrate-binding protein PstS, partial [Nonomuraea sp.]|nr:phosphate ABC transporter substrate-binding protein PstS [Nonomuraea sp.]